MRQNLVQWVESQSDMGLWDVCRIIRSAGGTAWLVGGSTRDALLGGSPKDIDLATDLDSDHVLEIFGPKRAKATGEAYGTVTVTAGGAQGGHGAKYEVTTLRREGAYTDGRRPDEVVKCDRIEEDLARRDFTINAMAFDPLEGVLVDPFGGLRDLEDGVLRVVVDDEDDDKEEEEETSSAPARRLSEDGLRVWRAYRFLDDGLSRTRRPSRELDGALSSDRARAAAAAVSRERVWDEFQRTLAGWSAPEVLERMADDGALRTVFAGLRRGDEIESRGDFRVRAQHYLLRCRRRLSRRAPSGSPRGATTTTRFVSLDLEATCSEQNNTFPQEVIQLSATLFEISDEGGPRAIAEFDSYCQPVIHRELTEFCTSLTGITQSQVDGAPRLRRVLGNFERWLQQHELLEPSGECEERVPRAPDRSIGRIADVPMNPSLALSPKGGLKSDAVLLTCGSWDLGKLVPIQCRANSYNFEVPAFLTEYCDVQEVFSDRYWAGSNESNSLGTMAARLGVRRAGRAHNAMSDSRDLAAVAVAMAADGCESFPTRRAEGREGPRSRGWPDASVARAALLLHGRDAAEAQKWMQGIGWRRNEDKKVVKACLTAFRAFPTKDATITEMAAYKRFVGHRLDFHICLESALACARGGWLSDGHVEAERVGEALRQFRDLEPLAGGEWIMQRTGLEKGKRLGRLKEWLWKLQIERGCETLEEMGAILDEIDWREGDVDAWPRFLQLK